MGEEFTYRYDENLEVYFARRKDGTPICRLPQGLIKQMFIEFNYETGYPIKMNTLEKAVHFSKDRLYAFVDPKEREYPEPLERFMFLGQENYIEQENRIKEEPKGISKILLKIKRRK